MDGSEIGFFTAQPYMVGGPGFGVFSLVHFAYLGYSIALIAVLVHVYGGLREGVGWGTPRRTMLLVVAGIPLLLLISQDAIMSSAGVFGAQWWPLHSCNICEYLGLIYALRPNKFSGEVLFTLGIVGALLAIVFPNWWYCPGWSWPVVCGFTEHSCIIAFILMQAFAGDFKPRMRDIWQTVAFLAVYAPIAYWFNKAHDTNFLFVNTPSPGSPMVPAAEVFGNPGYLLPFALVILAAFFGIHALWNALERHGVPERFRARRSAKRTSGAAS